MKKFNWLLLAVLLTIVAIVPNTAAAFADQPVAFVVFDNSGNVTQQVYKMWREPVRWAYHFPDFKLVDTWKKRCRPICYEEDSRRNTSGSVSFGHCARHVRADGAGNDMA